MDHVGDGQDESGCHGGCLEGVGGGGGQLSRGGGDVGEFDVWVDGWACVAWIVGLNAMIRCNFLNIDGLTHFGISLKSTLKTIIQCQH